MKFHRFILINYIFLGIINIIISKKIGLTPLKCPGIYQFSSGREVNAVYLSRENLEIIEHDDIKQSITLCDVVPILLPDDSLGIVSTINNPSRSYNNMNQIITRDNGLYDNIPYHWKKDITNCKQQLFNLVSKNNFKSKSLIDQFLNFKNTLSIVLDLNITGLLLEVEDKYDDNLVSLGGAVILSKSENAIDYTFSKFNNELPGEKEISKQQACVVNCHLDELIGLSMALNISIYITKQLFDSVSVDASLLNSKSSDTKKLPMIFAKSKSINAKKKSDNNDKANNKPSNHTPEQPLLPWQIYDPQIILKLSSREKRVYLRAAGVTSLPRPREGMDLLDKMFYDLLDDGVREEVIRIQTINNNNNNNDNDDDKVQLLDSNNEGLNENKVIAATSSRQLLLQQINQALSKGNTIEAEILREQFMLGTMIIADPTQSKGSYDSYLDQDDWYLLARRKAMGKNIPPTPPTNKK